MPERCRKSRDPFRDYGQRSEFSWGPGLVPPGKEHSPPSRGGAYRGMCTPVELTPSDDLSVRVRESRWRPGDPPPGYPGDRVG